MDLKGCCSELQRSFTPGGTHFIQDLTQGHPFGHCHRIDSSRCTAGDDRALEARQMGLRRKKIAFASQLRQPGFIYLFISYPPYLRTHFLALQAAREASAAAAVTRWALTLACPQTAARSGSHAPAPELREFIRLDPSTRLGKRDARRPLLFRQPW